MKKIRYSTFETNSSSEHSISIAKKDRFLSWKNGNEDMYAREKPKHSEFPNTWGNFWSYQYYWEFNIFSPEELREKKLSAAGGIQGVADQMDRFTNTAVFEKGERGLL